MKNTDKSVDIYERLANALEALPHGFARTKSGVEIKLIKMAFMPEEVWLAGQLTRLPETAADIAQRVGRDVAEVTALLESLVPRGLVSLPGQTAGAGVLKAPDVQGEMKYRLRPFLVGWYEASMRRLDKEFAELFEQFVIDLAARKNGLEFAAPLGAGLGQALEQALAPGGRGSGFGRGVGRLFDGLLLGAGFFQETEHGEKGLKRVTGLADRRAASR